MRKAHEGRLLGEVVSVLNDMGAPRGAPVSEVPSQAQLDCLDHLREAVHDFGAPDVGLDGAGALRELCKSSCTYEGQVGAAEYNEGSVSWPPRGTRAVDPLDCLEGRPRVLLSQWQTHLLRDSATDVISSSVLRPFSDRVLIGSRRRYARFLRHLQSAGMLGWSTTAPTTVGVFFVRKKTGQLRIIFDTRKVNLAFEAPESTRLPTAGSFACLELQGDDQLHFADCDVCDAFLPCGSSGWFV